MESTTDSVIFYTSDETRILRNGLLDSAPVKLSKLERALLAKLGRKGGKAAAGRGARDAWAKIPWLTDLWQARQLSISFDIFSGDIRRSTMDRFENRAFFAVVGAGDHPQSADQTGTKI